MSLSEGAKRVLKRMKAAEGHWLSLASARSVRDEISELQDELLATPGSLHGIDGYILTTKGENWTEEPQGAL